MNAAPEFTIRLARRGDLDRLVVLEKLFSYDRISRRSFSRMIGSETCQVLVAERSGDHAILGNFVLFTRRRSKTARFYSLMIDPSVRRLGVGRALFAGAEAAVKAKGCTKVRCEVKRTNAPSRALLARFGYNEAGELPGYYDDGTDGIRMEKHLTTQEASAA